MTQPEELKKEEKLFWSTGKGTDVWKLFQATMADDTTSVESLLEHDPTLVRSAYNYRTALSIAVRENKLSVAKLLLNRGADPVNSGTSDTLLQIAKDRGYLEMEELLKKAIDFPLGSEEGETIAKAIRAGNLAEVETLLKQSPELVHARDERTNQPIHWAVMTRQPEMVDLLLKHGADIDSARYDGARPIQLTNGDYMFRGWRDVAKDHNHSPKDIFKLLIERGAYLDICMASLTGNIQRVAELLEEDASLANKPSPYVSYYPGSGTPLKNACIGGHYEVVKLLLEKGADPNLPEEGIAPMGHALHSAVFYRHIEIVKLLLENGAHPNVEIESSADTLSAAIDQKNQPMINLLCSYGAARKVHLLAYYGDVLTAAAVFEADPSKADDPNALYWAICEGQESIVKLMLRYQPDLAKKVSAGVTIECDHDKRYSLLQLLFNHGMNPDHTDWLGVTALHDFAKKGDISNAKIFIEHGASVNLIDEEFCTSPLGYAAKYNKAEMVEFLLQNGATPDLNEIPEWAKPLTLAKRNGNEKVVEMLSQAISKKTN